jgi:hypothetical protein
MKKDEALELIKNTKSPLKRQLLTVAIISKRLKEMGKDIPVIIGGCALAYYSREVYFTADIDLAFSDREALNNVLYEYGFKKSGRYWISEDLDIVVKAPASVLVGEDAPVETVEMDGDLQCVIIGL